MFHKSFPHPSSLPLAVMLLALFAAAAGCAAIDRPHSETAAAQPPGEWTALFRNGDAGYPRFRIPALLALENDVLLAFAEGRQPEFEGQHDDHSMNDIVLRRSLDGGDTWEPLQVVAEMGGDSLNDPCAVFVPETGRVLLMFQRFPQGYHARVMEHTEMADLGYGGPRNTQTFLTYSDDGGATWSEPRDITRSVRAEDAISVGSPGVGIVLSRGEHAGRILMPLYETIPLGDGERYWRNRAAISDDGGETWRTSERVPDEALRGYGNEAQLAERADGSILMHARWQDGGARVLQTVSQDGGETWSPIEDNADLVTTPCMTSLAAHPKDGGEWLLASLPNSSDDRENGTIMLSRDGGETWPVRRTVYEDGFAYSSLAILPDGRIGLFFERGPYVDLCFMIKDIDWLLGDGAAD